MTINEKILIQIKNNDCSKKYKKIIKDLLIQESKKSVQWHWKKTYKRKLESLIKEDDNYEV